MKIKETIYRDAPVDFGDLLSSAVRRSEFNITQFCIEADISSGTYYSIIGGGYKTIKKETVIRLQAALDNDLGVTFD